MNMIYNIYDYIRFIILAIIDYIIMNMIYNIYDYIRFIILAIIDYIIISNKNCIIFDTLNKIIVYKFDHL